MHEMDVQRIEAIDLDEGPELGHSIHLLFALAPAESIFPDGGKAPDFGQGRAHIPSGIIEFVRKFDKSKPLLKFGDGEIWHIDAVGLYRHDHEA